jgi:hypothetical protein
VALSGSPLQSNEIGPQSYSSSRMSYRFILDSND